ncbi:MAG: caspase family protein, partial [Cyclobacteriaceae bacterium]
GFTDKPGRSTDKSTYNTVEDIPVQKKQAIKPEENKTVEIAKVPVKEAQNDSYQKKLALIIGNSAYQNGAQLKNPVNDARAISSTLKNLGFEVMHYDNVTQKDMKKAIDAFGQRLKNYEVGLFYYAGHGIQYKGKNYMIPVEANLKAEQQVEYDCIAADRVLAYMEYAESKVNIILLDACRNNPFERSWSRSANGNGLAFMNAPSGSLIAYATSPGTTASDGTGNNGLYTSSLLKYMNTPGLTIEQMFKKVRGEVEEQSNGKQVPWESTSLKGEFYFSPSN